MRTRFEMNDEVCVVKTDSNWMYWVPSMHAAVGQVGRVVGFKLMDGDTYAEVAFQIDGIPRLWFFKDEHLRLVSEPEDDLEPEMSIQTFLLGGLPYLKRKGE